MSHTAKKRLSFASILVALAVVAVFAFDLPSSIEAAQQTQPADQTAGEESGDAKEEEIDPIPVAFESTEVGTVSSYLTATANLVPESEVEVLAEWEGRLAKLNVEEGQSIEKGQILAELAQGDAEIARHKAQLRFDTARQAYERAERLHQQELLAEEEFDQAEQTFHIAEQELAEAQWRLEKTFIRAPFSGRVIQRNVQTGQHVRPGDSLFRVADFEPLIARIYLPEKDVLALAPGRTVRLGLRADEAVRFDGRIQKISPVVDTATGTVKVTIEARDVPRAVRPGAFVRVDIAKETRQAAVLMPREAVVRELQSTYVFVARDGKASKRPVTLGIEENGLVEAISGLEAGEQVITAGQGSLEDGAAIRQVAPVA